MKLRIALITVLTLFTTAVYSQSKAASSTVLNAAETKPLLPANFFFEGRVAPAQARNSGAVRFADKKLFIATLVDTAGYSSGITGKFQGILIAESSILINGKSVPAGLYGFGVSADGKFNVLDIGGSPVTSADASNDASITHPVPLKISGAEGSFRLYLGRRYVSIAR
jgi:hypothetical protein